MSLESFALIVGVVVIIGALAYYLLITTEGVFLGERIVIWLYDIYASRYDNIKQYDAEWETETLAQPVIAALRQLDHPVLLDVATGTGRAPLTLFREPSFTGQIVGLDFSRKMLHICASKLQQYKDRLALIYQSALVLPFPDETFDVVTCFEALEFMPSPQKVLQEIVRVTKSGGLILFTNRRGWEARVMFGKTQSADRLKTHLVEVLKLEDVTIQLWQMDYEQVWAFKHGAVEETQLADLTELLRCPHCQAQALERHHNNPDANLVCSNCKRLITIASDGVIEYANAPA